MASQKVQRINSNQPAEYDFYSDLKNSRDISDFKEKTHNIVTRLGFSDYTIIPLDRDWENEDEQTLLSSYPEEYWNTYREEEFSLHDILISYAKINTRPILTSKVYDYHCNAPFDTESSCKNLAIRELDCSYGFFDSYAIPIINGDCRILLTLTQKNISTNAFKQTIDSKGTILRLLGQAIYNVIHIKFPALIKAPSNEQTDEQSSNEDITITPRQLRTLDLLANHDLPVYLVADTLSISTCTAHQHIAAARKALNKRTNTGAIKEAIKLGLLKYDS